MWEPHFRPDERLEDLDLERQVMEFLYRDAGNCVFMNPDNYEQEEIPAAIIGSSEQFVAEGMKVSVEFFEGRPISVVLPPSMEAKVADYGSEGSGSRADHALRSGKHLEGSKVGKTAFRSKCRFSSLPVKPPAST
jgi:elongation factor P